MCSFTITSILCKNGHFLMAQLSGLTNRCSDHRCVSSTTHPEFAHPCHVVCYINVSVAAHHAFRQSEETCPIAMRVGISGVNPPFIHYRHHLPPPSFSCANSKSLVPGSAVVTSYPSASNTLLCSALILTAAQALLTPLTVPRVLKHVLLF